jgi:hypothetical protein
LRSFKGCASTLLGPWVDVKQEVLNGAHRV